ncbi:heterokaryon incompatibility protein-domain-containing protein [Hypoxylon rubiginosum]|uniref:Heterokaryon incompatibility protein-domain-containing protein n=1 Tax=Hypoxylon rubiginosum TaxID=110542 RepID=A0ACC0D0T2_9PEZI|nr:heterokaryon incompatibility protein-domain-containing protein [Hypoxylon rubiginosum]
MDHPFLNPDDEQSAESNHMRHPAVAKVLQQWTNVLVKAQGGKQMSEEDIRQAKTCLKYFKRIGQKIGSLSLLYQLSAKAQETGLSGTALLERMEADGGMPDITQDDDDTDYSDVSSISAYEAQYGWRVAPWKDEDIFEDLPECFTLNLDESFEPEEEFFSSMVCSCSRCGLWFGEMLKTYTRPRFCVSWVDDPSDLKFFRAKGLKWPEGVKYDSEHHSDDDNDDEYVYKNENEEIEQCMYRSAILICLGSDHELSPATPTKRIHLLINDETGTSGQDTFTIRAFFHDDPSADIFTPFSGGVHPDPSSHENWDRARGYLAWCQEHHRRCQQRDLMSSRLDGWPMRVVEVDRTPLRLRDSDDLLPHEIGRGYAVLSYCWGPPPHDYSTVRENLRRRYHNGILLQSLPATIQDAVRAARELSMRFLWVDGLCITQDDTEEKAVEISRMDQIYTNGKLLISAASARSAKDGFLDGYTGEYFDEVELEYGLPFHCQYKGEKGGVALERWKDSSEKGTAHDVIHERGWTMQEHLLSTRILAFGANGMRWQCLENSRFGSHNQSSLTDDCELLSRASFMTCRTLEPGRPESDPEPDEWALPSFGPTGAGAEWDTLRTKYLDRQLTVQSDVLPAFAAVPRQFIGVFGDESDYIAGHWRMHLPIDLLWDGSNYTRARDGTFPTWSWPPVKRATGNPWSSPRFCTGDNSHLGVSKAQLVDTETTFVYPSDPFNDVKSAKLLLYGNLLPVGFNTARQPDINDMQVLENVVTEVICFARPTFEYHKEWSKIEVEFDRYYSHMDRELFVEELMKPQDRTTIPEDTEMDQNPWSGLYLLELARHDEGSSPGCFMYSEGLVVRMQSSEKYGMAYEFIRMGTFTMGCDWSCWDHDDDDGDENDEGNEDDNDWNEGEHSGDDEGRLESLFDLRTPEYLWLV